MHQFKTQHLRFVVIELKSILDVLTGKEELTKRERERKEEEECEREKEKVREREKGSMLQG